MKRIDRLPELLAPAGDMDSLVAAVEAGADAVYVGGKLYSARSYAKNFDLEGMKRAVEYCHLHGAKLYVTVNTLLYDEELMPALEFARELYLIGVDALIVCDLGYISLLREYLPELELHASTQMSVHNSDGADMAARLGCKRVVLARELSAVDMAATIERCEPECEVFLHGALCVCHSGQCLFSSMVGGRSGNRGECAQPCRLPFTKGGKEYYPLSLSDLSLAHHIPELISMGVASLKIEGRMKSPEYVYTVTSIYRRLIDEGRRSTKEEDEALGRAFSRGGFTDGYFRGETKTGMTGIRSEADKSKSREMTPLEIAPSHLPVKAKIEIRMGEPSRLTLTPVGRTDIQPVTVLGDSAEPARNAPLDKEGVRARVAKMGNTYLSLSLDDIEVLLDEGVNLSPAAINRLRRLAADRLACAVRDLPERELPTIGDMKVYGEISRKYSDIAAPVYEKTAMLYNPELLSSPAVGYFDRVFIPLFKLSNAEGNGFGVAMPPVVFEGEVEAVMSMLKKARARGIVDCLVGNIGHIDMVREAGLIPIPDFRLNVMNNRTRLVYERLGLKATTLSPELTLGEAGRIGGRVLVYGRIPLMLTERCFIRDSFGCDGCNISSLTDRRGAEFPMMREFEHRNIIFNSAVTYMGDKPEELTRVKFKHFIFSVETPKELSRVVDAYKRRVHAAIRSSLISATVTV